MPFTSQQIRFLTDLVPHEPAYCLRAHLTNQMYTPRGCQEVKEAGIMFLVYDPERSLYIVTFESGLSATYSLSVAWVLLQICG